MSAVVIGIGNDLRRDDGIGPAVAAAIADRAWPGVRVVSNGGDAAAILEAWNGAALAVVIDAAVGDGCRPGRVRRWTRVDAVSASTVSSHTLDLAQTHALAEAVGQLPKRLVIFTVDAADTGYGAGLTPQVAAAVPAAADAICAELATGG